MGINGLNVTAESLGSLLGGKSRIAVPMYQRHYSWERKQIDALVEDMRLELEKPKKEQRTLFLGTIVFNTESAGGERSTDLIDGQQRLFTLSLVQLWWIRRLAEVDTQRSGAALLMLKNLLFNDDVEDLGKATEAEIRERLRLRSSLHDRTNYESLVRRGKGGQRGRSRLITAYRIIEEHYVGQLQRIAKEKGVAADPEDPKFKEITVGLAERINDLMTHRISFGVVEVEPPFDPFVVFESLNSKGLELAQSDLIKNFLLKELNSDALRQEALQKWDAMVQAIPGEKIVEFLRAWFIAYHRHVQRSALYDAFRELLKAKARIPEYLDDWVRVAWWFRALYEGRINDNHPVMSETRIEPALKRGLENWAKLGFKQGVPVLLSLLHPSVCNPEQRTGQLRLVEGMQVLESAYVRLFVSGNVRGSVFENKLDKLCQIGKNQKQNAVANIRGVLHDMCEAESVAGKLDWSNISRPIHETRYLLYRIVEFQVGSSMQMLGSDLWHVEHILPQSRKGGFTSDSEQEDYDELVSKMGNLTLLLEGDNTSLGNRAYTDKVSVFRKYDGGSQVKLEDGETRRPKIALNLDIAQRWPKSWGPATIQERGKLLGEYAAQVWDLSPDT